MRRKWLPWIVTGVFGLWVLSTLRPPEAPSGELDVYEFGRLPVLLNGRVQPWDSVARNSLLIIRQRQTVGVEEEGKESSMHATAWLAEVLMAPDRADERKIFRMDHPEVKGLFGLDPDEKYYSFNELEPKKDELQRQAEIIRQKKSELRTPFEKQVFKLNESFVLYFRLKSSLKPEGAVDFERELELFEGAIRPGLEAVRKSQTGEDFNQEDLLLMSEFFQRYQVLARLAYPLIIPPLLPEEKREDWKNMGTSLMEAMRRGELHPASHFYADMSAAYRDGNAAEFSRSISEYKEWLGRVHQPEVRKANWEFFYNHYGPFYTSMVLYVAAFLFGCASWFNFSKWLNLSGFWLTLLALIIHTSGLIFRMVLEGRPPVTNLYSSAIFVGWGAVVLGAILEKFYRNAIGTVVAGAVGFTTLVIAHNLSLDGDTMEMLRAVLDTNFWLATHVVVITMGYSAVFVAGLLAIIYLLRGTLTKSLDGPTARALTRMVYGIICFATLFSFVGTVLGGIWADQSWGRFWGWDPKENGALLIVIWCAIILHARWGGLIRERGLMGMAVFGNIVTAFSWFGVNMLGVGLHSYGFMDQAFRWLMLFVVSQLIFIGLAMIPLRHWRSYSRMKGGDGGRPGGGNRGQDNQARAGNVSMGAGG